MLKNLYARFSYFSWDIARGVVLKKEVWERRFHKRGFPTPFQKKVWERRAKKEVWELCSHTK